MNAVEKGAIDALTYLEGHKPEIGEGLHLNTLFGGGRVTTFQGKTNLYDLETYNSGRAAFTDMPEYAGLVDLATEVYLATYPNRGRDKSIERMRKGLSYPRTILMLALHEGYPVGFGIFPRLFTPEGSVLYSSRAFQRGHDGQGLGTYVLRKGIRLQQEESAKAHRLLHWGNLMTQNELSIYTLGKLKKAGVIEKIFPFDHLYDEAEEDEKDKDTDAARHIMLGMHNRFHIDSIGINNFTGVSKGELRELGPNETYRRPPENPELLAIYSRMVKAPTWNNHLNLYMNLPDGDVVYTTFKLKRSGNGGGVAEIPLESLDEDAA